MVRKCRNPWCQGTGKVHRAAFELEEADVPSAGSGKRFRRWSGTAAFLVLVLLALKLAKDVVVGATLDVLSMLR